MYYPPFTYSIQIRSKNLASQKACENSILDALNQRDYLKFERIDGILQRSYEYDCLTGVEQSLFKSICETAAATSPDCVIQLDAYNCDLEENHCSVFIDNNVWHFDDLYISAPDLLARFEAIRADKPGMLAPRTLEDYFNAVDRVKNLFQVYTEAYQKIEETLA